MGLDIYLYRCHVESVERLIELTEEQEAISESAWGSKPYEDMTDEEKESARERASALQTEHREKHNMPVFMTGSEAYQYETVGEEKIEHPSKYGDDHYFKLGYFRSSYNSGGINSIAREFSVPCLYDIFGNPDEYMFAPEWELSYARAKHALAEWQELSKRHGKLRVMSKTVNPLAGNREDYPVSSEEQAMSLVLENLNKSEHFDSFSNLYGSYFTKGVKVVGLFSGTNDRGEPTAYIVTEHEEETLDWYVKAIEIVIETIEWVLNQDEPDKYFLHWSS